MSYPRLWRLTLAASLTKALDKFLRRRGFLEIPSASVCVLSAPALAKNRTPSYKRPTITQPVALLFPAPISPTCALRLRTLPHRDAFDLCTISCLGLVDGLYLRLAITLLINHTGHHTTVELILCPFPSWSAAHVSRHHLVGNKPLA